MTVIARRFVAAPVRTASPTWAEISAMICGDDSSAAAEFSAVAGVASSAIADEALKANPLVIKGAGPRLRVYCLYGEDAISGDDKNESALTTAPTQSDWHAFLPCAPGDIAWFSSALTAKSKKFTAYDPANGIPDDEGGQAKSLNSVEAGFSIDAGRFRAT